MIARAFYNVIKNAIQYTESGGKIRIYTISDLKFQSIIIENDIQGMIDERASKLFQPFYRVDDSRNRFMDLKDIFTQMGFQVMEK